MLPLIPQNPAYFEIEDTEPSRMAPITGLALEIWTVDGVSQNTVVDDKGVVGFEA